MKRTVAVILFFCLLAPYIGTVTLFHAARERVRSEVKRKLIQGADRKELVRISLPTRELNTRLRWIHEREFELENTMFDVVERKVTGDSTHLLCWNDHAETGINRQLTRLIASAAREDPFAADARKNITDWFKIIGIPLPWRGIEAPERTGKPHILCFNQEAESSCSIRPPSPPPKPV